jgi:hypothetical protein
MTLTLGSKLGSYEVLSLLGAGGMGVSYYRIRLHVFERDLIVSVAPPEVAEAAR